LEKPSKACYYVRLPGYDWKKSEITSFFVHNQSDSPSCQYCTNSCTNWVQQDEAMLAMISSLENKLLENPSEAAAIMRRLQMWLRAIWNCFFICASDWVILACSFSLFWNLRIPELKPCPKKLHLKKNHTETSQFFFSPFQITLIYPSLV
jgi:hypothetical protein